MGTYRTATLAGLLFLFFVSHASAAVVRVDLPKLTAPKSPDEIKPKNPTDPEKLPANRTRSVLIIGGGVAGLSAANELSVRGFNVTIREATSSAGGRLATTPVKALGQTFNVSKMFVSWMHNHYQFNAFLKKLGADKNFLPWEKIDYEFKSYKPEQIYNKGNYPWNLKDMLDRSPNIDFLPDEVLAFIRSGDLRDFNCKTVFSKFDKLTPEQWRAKAGMPQHVFDIFFKPLITEMRNNPNTTSAAELLTYFQLYYMSDPQADEARRSVAKYTYGKALLNDWIKYLNKTKRVRMDYNKKVGMLEFTIIDPRSSAKVKSDNTAPKETYDYVIIATDLDSAKVIVENSMNANTGVPAIFRPLSNMMVYLQDVKSAPPYKILQVWYDKQPASSRPAVFTPDMTPLNLAVQLHLLEDEYTKWAKKTNGSVIEYQLNQWTFGDMNATEILKRIKPSVQKVFPELFSKKAKVLFTRLGTYQDVPSFDHGIEFVRPNVSFPVDQGMPNLYFAGDWVKTSYPAAIMEKAVSTAWEAVNEILLKEKVRQEPMSVTPCLGPGF